MDARAWPAGLNCGGSCSDAFGGSVRGLVATVSTFRQRSDVDPEARSARRYDRVLLDLSMRAGASSGGLSDALSEICVAAARALEVERAGVWLFGEKHRAIRSLVSYERSRDRFLPPAELLAADYPRYFEALERQRVIAAHDAHRDPRTAEFSPGYLAAHGITSMLDAPVRLHGELLGTICHEHVGPPRTWSREDERFAASLGDLVALALAADERRRAEAALRASEARHRVLVAGALDIIFTLSVEGDITSLNPAFTVLLGRPVDDWVGRHFRELIHPDDLDLALDVFARALTGEPLSAFEIRLLREDGQPSWFEFTLGSTDEGSHYVFGIGRDVTARKRAELRRRVLADISRELARAEGDLASALGAVHARLAGVLPCSRVATVVVDRRRGTLETLASSGEPADPAAAPFPPVETVERAVARGETLAVRGGPGHEGSEAAGRGPGRSLVASVMRTAAGPRGALVAAREDGGAFHADEIDLCDAVAREIALALAAAEHRREERAEAEVTAALAHVGQQLISSVDLPVLLESLCRVTAETLGGDVSHTFLYDEVTDAFLPTAAFGGDRERWEQVRGSRITAAESAGLAAALQAEDVILLDAGDGRVAPHVWRAYGTEHAIVMALRRGDRIIGAQSASRCERSSPFGDRHVRIARGIAHVASLALANARLVEKLEAASRLKSDFVATISHELRTPLNVILGYNELLLLEEFGSLSEEQRETLGRMRASAAELLELIDATLDLSRLETGGVTLQLGDIDLGRWLVEVQHETASIRERKPQVQVAWSVAGDPGVVHSDALKLKVILKNLISNAVKFTHEGSIEVSVATRGPSLELVVRDTGIGMTPATRAVIFEPFRQGDGSMTRRYGGVGLGLYIVSRLLDALAGRIEVESETARGTCFRIEVPVDARQVRSLRRAHAQTSGT